MNRHGTENGERNERMIQEIYQAIKIKENLRENLTKLKQLLKTPEYRERFVKITGKNYDFLMKLLVEEDPKVRKNAAGVLGDLHCQDALDLLLDAYEEEETLFIRADYIKAMANLDCREYLDVLESHLEELTAREEIPENEKKHVQEEIRQLQLLILAQGERKPRIFNGYTQLNDVILVTRKAFYDVTQAQIRDAKVARTGLGLRVQTANLDQLLEIRTYKELLFVLHGADRIPSSPQEAAKALADTDLLELLEKNHAQGDFFCFRVTISGPMSLEQRSMFIRKLSMKLEELTDRRLINTPSNYEIEIRLIQMKDGSFYPVLKFYTLKDNRFAYRRYTISAGMQPFLAAGMLKLVEEELTEHAQVLDPFCGTGTMLIERNYLMAARDSYGLDIFGEGIDKARVNTKIARMNINYIHRDFGDFRHDYLFDEILTDMPEQGNMSREELDKIYQMLFDRGMELLKPGGKMFVYASEMGMLKKQIRLHGNAYILKREYCISEKQKKYLYVIQFVNK